MHPGDVSHTNLQVSIHTKQEEKSSWQPQQISHYFHKDCKGISSEIGVLVTGSYQDTNSSSRPTNLVCMKNGAPPIVELYTGKYWNVGYRGMEV